MTTSPPARRAPASLITLFLVGGLVAAAGGGFAASQLREYFDMPEDLKAEFERSKGANPPPELMERMRVAGIQAEYRNAALVVGLTGGLLCGLLGALAGFARSAVPGMAIGWAAGVIVGAPAGAGGGLLARYVIDQIPVATMDSFIRAMLIQAGAWVPIGLAAGLVVGLFTGGVKTATGTAASALLAAAIGAALFPFASMYLMPVNRLDRAVPESLTAGLLWTALPCLLIALATGRLCAIGLRSKPAGGAQATS